VPVPTDFDGVNVATGAGKYVPLGVAEFPASTSGESSVLLAKRSLRVASGELIPIARVINRHWITFSKILAGAQTTTTLLHQGMRTGDTEDMPFVTPRASKLSRVAVSAFTSSSAPANWTLRLRLDGSGSDTATFSFAWTNSPTANTVTTGVWATGAGAAIAEGKRVTALIDGASITDLWVMVNAEFEEAA
jgi:hypothetical protein